MKKMNVLPFYMTYPTVAYTKENGMVEDLEYFQQMYLNGARMLQREIDIRRIWDFCSFSMADRNIANP